MQALIMFWSVQEQHPFSAEFQPRHSDRLSMECEPLTSHALKTVSASPYLPPSLLLSLSPTLPLSPSLSLLHSLPPSLPLSISPLCHSYHARQQKISLQSEAEHPSLPWPPEEPQGLEPPNTQDASSFSLPVHCGDCISDIEFSLFWRVKQQPPKASP